MLRPTHGASVLLLLLLLLQASLFDKVQAHTDELVDAGPVPGIESFCVYSEDAFRAAG
jgi:hypothetical protein